MVRVKLVFHIRLQRNHLKLLRIKSKSKLIYVQTICTTNKYFYITFNKKLCPVSILSKASISRTVLLLLSSMKHSFMVNITIFKG